MGTTTITPLRNLNFFNVRDFAGSLLPDGNTDFTTAIANARAATRAAGGGTIFYPPGTYISGNQDISNDAFVYHEGSGKGATVIKLKGGANADLFSASPSLINLSAAFGGPSGTLHSFGFANMTIDGNKANQFTSPSQYLALYTDTFGVNSSANYGTSVGSATWTWDTANNRLTGNGGSNNYLFYSGVQRADGYVEVVLDTATGNDGVAARYLDRNNNYIIYIGDASAGGLTNQVQLARWVGGSFTALQTVSIAFTRGTQHTFRLQTIGSTITVLMDGVQIIQVTDTGLSRPGYFGLMAQADSPAIRCYSFTVAGGLSYPLRLYAYDYIMDGVELKDGYSGNVLSDWHGNDAIFLPPNDTDSLESQWVNCKSHNAGGIGMQFGGPHDSVFSNCIFYLDAYHDIHLAPNAVGCQFVNNHAWEPGSGFVAILNETTQASFVGCQAESSDTVQVVLTNLGTSWLGGHIFGGIYTNTVGVQIGQAAGQTPYYGQVLISNGLCTDNYASQTMLYAHVSHCQGANGAIWIAKQSSGCDIRVIADQSAGAPYIGPITPGNVSIITDSLSPSAPFASLVSGLQIASASTIYSGSGVPSTSLGNNGDYYLRSDTPGTANQRIYVKSAGAWASLNQNFINLADYCKIDGTTDDSTGFTTAYTLASTLSMGLWHPGGTLVKGNDTLLANVPIIGPGPGLATIKLKGGANADLFSANTGNINLSSSFGTGSATGISNFGFANLTLDGNKANQSSGTSYPLRFYGYGCALDHVEIKNGYTGGILCDWNNTEDPTGGSIFSCWRNVIVHLNNGIGIETGGPTDQQWSQVNSFRNGSHNLHIAPNAAGLQGDLCHFYGTPIGTQQYVAALIEGSACIFTNSQFEGSDVCQVVILGSDGIITACRIYAAPAGNVVGVQLGQNAGGTPYPGSVTQSGGLTTASFSGNNRIDAQFRDCQTGAINEVYTGNNIYTGRIVQSTGTSIASGGGYLGSSSSANLLVSGVTADGTSGKGGTFQVANSSYNGFTLVNGAGATVLQHNTYNGGLALLNGALFQGYSDSGSTLKLRIDSTTGDIATNGNIATGQSATAPDPGASGTVATANIGESRVNPTGGSRSSCVLAAGTAAGQEVWVINEHASNTISWATQATSHIAGEAGGTFVLAANRAQHFKWDSAVSLWFKTT